MIKLTSRIESFSYQDFLPCCCRYLIFIIYITQTQPVNWINCSKYWNMIWFNFFKSNGKQKWNPSCDVIFLTLDVIIYSSSHQSHKIIKIKLSLVSDKIKFNSKMNFFPWHIFIISVSRLFPSDTNHTIYEIESDKKKRHSKQR